MKVKLKDIIAWSYIIGLGALLAYIIIGGLIRRQSLNKNWAYAQAIVIDDFTSYKSTDYFRYTFSIGENVYKGSGTYDRDSEIVLVGDTVTVIYDKTDPENNMALRDYMNEPF